MTKIEWTDRTWNPVTGCTKVSPGCDHCYAETFSERFRGTAGHHFEQGFDLTLRPERLTLPLRWRKESRIFLDSMFDPFHEGIPDDYIARMFAVMALTPQHTYQVLTKRHGRMRSLVGGPCSCGHPPGEHLKSAMAWAVSLANPDRIPGLPDDAEHRVYHETEWPLPNVWLGVSVENQKWADIRIPALASTPAAVRFLSCEPLLGPLDLTQWMPPISPVPAEQAPATWAEWTWPDWVPDKVRAEIESFWGDEQGRSPRHWIRAMHQEAGTPPFGATLRMDDGFAANSRKVTGRFVYCWGNIGRLVLDDDPNREYAYTSFGHRDRARARGIDWVIAGGESGPRARAVHPDWLRRLRDQSVAADVPFFMKQWGEWGPAPFIVRVCDPEIGWQGSDEELAAAKADSEARGATHVHTGHSYDKDGERSYWLHEIGHKPWSLERVGLPDGTAAIRRWGKQLAGRELDGRTWDQFPEPVRHG